MFINISLNDNISNCDVNVKINNKCFLNTGLKHKSTYKKIGF